MTDLGPMLWIAGGWIPCRVLKEIPPKRETDAGFLEVETDEAPPDDATETWKRFGGRRLRVPAYQVYQYEAESSFIKTGRTGGSPLGAKDALASGKTAPFASSRQVDAVVDLDKSPSDPPSDPPDGPDGPDGPKELDAS